MDEKLAKRFWAKVDKDGPTMPGMNTNCWIWTSTKKNGYGQFSLNNKDVSARRLAYEAEFGQIEFAIYNLCKNKSCVRPDHYHQPSKVLTARFWTKVDKNGPLILETNCWVWTAFCDREGYGRFKVSKRIKPNVQFAHKLSFLDAGGILTPSKYRVLHKCNNRACVNPTHLYAGDQRDNDLDAMEAGTWFDPSRKDI